MYKIQEAEMLANNIYRMVVEAPRVAHTHNNTGRITICQSCLSTLYYPIHRKKGNLIVFIITPNLIIVIHLQPRRR